MGRKASSSAAAGTMCARRPMALDSRARVCHLPGVTPAGWLAWLWRGARGTIYEAEGAARYRGAWARTIWANCLVLMTT